MMTIDVDKADEVDVKSIHNDKFFIYLKMIKTDYILGPFDNHDEARQYMDTKTPSEHTAQRKAVINGKEAKKILMKGVSESYDEAVKWENGEWKTVKTKKSPEAIKRDKEQEKRRSAKLKSAAEKAKGMKREPYDPKKGGYFNDDYDEKSHRSANE